jgi:hypothetical protein
MFERYTEKARRTIFFARYEASNFGSPFIETEHLLLGLLREDRDNVARLLPAGHEALNTIRAQIEARTPPRKAVSTSVDLPLSNEGKRVLAYAAEEAERLHHRHIGTEHLFLGLLREEGCFAAELLHGHGARLPELRGKLSTTQPQWHTQNRTSVLIRDQRWDSEYVDSIAKDLRRFAWLKQDWQPRDLLVENKAGRVMFYMGQPFDDKRFTLSKGAWTRDHCAICRWELNRDLDPEHHVGYSNGREWLCPVCYEQFVAPKVDPRDDIYT